jgi:outer membrane protein TolC
MRKVAARGACCDLLLLAALLVGAAQLGAQPLSLATALDRGDRLAYANRAARGAEQIQAADATRTLRGILPTVRVDAGFQRSNDPVGAFGTTLRQRTLTQEDFDPQRLNFPAAVRNYTGAVVIEQPLFNADAWAARGATSFMTQASSATTRWTAIDARTHIVRAYYAAILAQHEVATLDAALRAAREHLRQAEALVKNGLVTPSDALLASVKAGEVETSFLEARGRAATARLQLAVTLGDPADTTTLLPAALPPSTAIVALARDARAMVPQRPRDDVAAAQLRHTAAARDAQRAKALFLPRINSFARYDWNAAAYPFAGTKNWSVGVMASWTPFTGAAELADLQATRGQQSAADAQRAGVEARAQLEREQSAIALDVGIARLEVAERSLQQSADAHRIVARKYAGGIATIVELLDAAATETSSRLAHSAARYALINAVAERQRAFGGDPGVLRALDAAALATASANPNESQ